MKRWAVFSLLLVLTACQPATAAPTNTQFPPTATEPKPSPTSPPQPSPTRPIYQIWPHPELENRDCCISIPAGEPYTLNFQLNVTGPTSGLNYMKITTRYGEANPLYDEAALPYTLDQIEAREQAAWQPFTREVTLEIEEVLPYRNQYEVCVHVSYETEDLYGQWGCDWLFIDGIPQDPDLQSPHIDPMQFTSNTRIKLPEWLDDPAGNVFVSLMHFIDEEFVLTFFKAETQDRFDMNVKHTAGYFWTPDGRHFGLVEAHSQRVHLIRLEDGSVRSFDLSEKSMQPVMLDGWLPNLLETFREEDNPLPEPLSANGNDPDDPAFRLLNRREPGTRYILSWYHSDDFIDTRIEVTDLESAESFLLTPGNDEVQDMGMALSPSGDRVAVIQGELTYTWFQPGTHLSIYSLGTGEVLSQFQGPFWNITWSPDGQELLYSTITTTEYLPDPTPCILNLTTGERRCLNSIEKYFQDLLPANIFNFRYSQDSERLFFRYQRHFPKDDFNYRYYGGICYIVLMDGEIACPSDEFNPWWVHAPQSMIISPDERFVAISSNLFPHFGDEGGKEALIVLGLEESSFFFLGFNNLSNLHGVYNPNGMLLWRPAIQP